MMSKAVLISIRPKWCELIASGKKTVEVRKTKPKLETPFKVYIYCTKPYTGSTDDNYYIYLPPHYTPKRANGTVIGEFVCDEIISADRGSYKDIHLSDTRLQADELLDYAEDKRIFGWHISDLVIYDKPKYLSEFHHCHTGDNIDKSGYPLGEKIRKAPQSWCYVEV